MICTERKKELDKMPPSGNYNHNIFINFPSNKEYLPIFRAIIFAIQANGFIPIFSAQRTGGEPRFEKICSIISECNYAIHDISLVNLDRRTSLPRFNMAFELGLYLGCKKFGKTCHQSKNFLVLDKIPHQTKKTLSDLDHIDSVGYRNSRFEALKKVNTWLCQERGNDIIGNAWLVSRFKKFERIYPDLCKKLGVDFKNPEIQDELILSGKFLYEEQRKVFQLRDAISIKDNVEIKLIKYK